MRLHFWIPLLLANHTAILRCHSLLALLFLALSDVSLHAGDHTVTTIAGAPREGYRDGPAAQALFSDIWGMATDGTRIFVADSGNHCIRAIATDGTVSTMVGLAGQMGAIDGPPSTATMAYPRYLAMRPGTNLLYVTSQNGNIREIDTTTGAITTVAGGSAGYANGTGTAAQFSDPSGICWNAGGTIMYIADAGNRRIRAMTSSYVVSTLCGNGTSAYVEGAGSAASFKYPRSIACGNDGNLYVTDILDNRVRKITPGGTTSLLAGDGSYSNADGTGAAAGISVPSHIVSVGSTLYCITNGVVRSLSLGGVVTTVSPSVINPTSLGIGPTNSLLAASSLPSRVVSLGGTITHIAGPNQTDFAVDGPAADARFLFLGGIAAMADGTIYVTDENNFTIRKLAANGIVSTIAGSPGEQGAVDAQGTAARFRQPRDIVRASNGALYISDSYAIRRIDAMGNVTTLAGQVETSGFADGTGTAARFSFLSAIAIGPDQNIYAIDSSNHAIRRITPAGVVTTVAGDPSRTTNTDGPRTSAGFANPSDIAVAASGMIYVCDPNGRTVRSITATGTVSTIAGVEGVGGTWDGIGTTARFSSPRSLDDDASGHLVILDEGTIRTLNTTSMQVTTVAGSFGKYGAVDGTGSAVRTSGYTRVSIAGNTAYIAEANQGTIRKSVPPTGSTPGGGTIGGGGGGGGGGCGVGAVSAMLLAMLAGLGFRRHRSYRR